MTFGMDLSRHFHLRAFLSPRGTYTSHQFPPTSIPTIMSQQHPHFHSKCLAKMYVAEKSIEEKKSFKVSRSDPRRYEVVCTDPDCLYRLNFRAKKDDPFHVTKSSHEHTCDFLSPTFKKVWVRQRVTELLCQRG